MSAASHLSIVLDCNALIWQTRQEANNDIALQSEQPSSPRSKGVQTHQNSVHVRFDDALSAALSVARAHLLVHHLNSLTVHVAALGVASLVHTVRGDGGGAAAACTLEQHIRDALRIVSEKAKKAHATTKSLAQKKGNDEKQAKRRRGERSVDSSLAAALSLALCWLSANLRRGTQARTLSQSGRSADHGGGGSAPSYALSTLTRAARCVVFTASPEAPSQYISLMNCIFSAQKLGVPLDACILAAYDVGYWQQAAALSGGAYWRFNSLTTENVSSAHTKQQKLSEEQQLRGALLQGVLTHFAPDALLRAYINVPIEADVDYRASCFCHKRMVDLGYVCAVCLSIYCEIQPVCRTCGIKFVLPKAKQ